MDFLKTLKNSLWIFCIHLLEFFWFTKFEGPVKSWKKVINPWNLKFGNPCGKIPLILPPSNSPNFHLKCWPGIFRTFSSYINEHNIQKNIKIGGGQLGTIQQVEGEWLFRKNWDVVVQIYYIRFNLLNVNF